MLPDKITKKFKEISKFFVENFDNSANAIFTVLDMLKLNFLGMAKHGNTKYCYKGKILTINDLITKDTLELTINERIILFIRNLVENIKNNYAIIRIPYLLI